MRHDACAAQGLPRIMQGSAIVASLVCLLVVLFQLNGRIAADPGPLIQGGVAPFEWAGAGRGGACGCKQTWLSRATNSILLASTARAAAAIAVLACMWKEASRLIIVDCNCARRGNASKMWMLPV